MKVSVCIPAYKHVAFLEQCLDSVLKQNFTDYEIIITDDSPDDLLLKLVNKYSDKRIKYFKNIKPLGSPKNWNEGLKKARGEYIKILHHDDCFSSSESLGKFVQLLDENPDVDIAFSASSSINNNNPKTYIAKKSFLKNVEKEAEFVFRGNQFGAPSVCIFRNKEYFFDSNLIWLVDIDFYKQVITAQNNKFAFTPELLINIGVSEFQITQQCVNNVKIRVRESLYLYHKYRLNQKSIKYRLSLLKTMGRGKIYTTTELRKILPYTHFSFSNLDSIIARIYYTKRRIGIFLFR